MAEKDQDEQLVVQEDKDGSAVVDVPANLLPPDDDEPQEAADTRNEAPADEHDEDQPGDSDAVREARRARRRAKKQLVRETNRAKDVELQQLRRQNELLEQRLQQVERHTAESQMARLDKALEDGHVRLEFAKMKIQEATAAGDGDAMAEAQNLFYEARQQIEQLRQAQQQAAQAPQQQAQRPDPRVQRNANAWLERNSWYDVKGRDTDSRVAKQVDQSMIEEGWDPKDPDYWDELDSRLQKYLPHRYNQSAENESVRQRPRNVVASSGREASAAYGGTNRGTFVLSPERVRAMKDAGAWDNPQRKKAMIQKFMEYDRLNKNRS